MNKRTLVIALFTATLLTSAFSHAQDAKAKEKGRPSPEKIIARLDANEDGKLSKEEVANAKKGKLAERFDKVDANSDGFIDIDELAEFQSQRTTRREE